MYKQTIDGNTIIRIEDNTTIPIDTANIDYIDYQKWLDSGNSISPAKTQSEIDQEIIDKNNAAVIAELAAADLKAIRALIEDDKARIATINQAQKDRRKKLIPPG